MVILFFGSLRSSHVLEMAQAGAKRSEDSLDEAKREGLLQVAEMAEEKEKEEVARGNKTPVKDEEELQEGKELLEEQPKLLGKAASTKTPEKID
ncbi:hypothetical protein TWF730_008890 [Orbilia blumenaviensis]|uniref:Uncharacterized protein n=1 Tax=Orbilia blumenaviensis TaxID=1796055 RepID=A0AAV9V627_9PEZI